MSFQVERKVTWGTILNGLIMLSIVISGFVYIQSDMQQVKERQEVQEDFRQDVRTNYINREQLDYMVIQRIDRMERNIDTKLDRIEKALE